MKTLPLALVAVFAVFTGAVAPPADAAAPAAQPLVTDVPLPGGVAALLRAVDAPGAADPATAMLAFVRVVHGGKGTPSEVLLRQFDAIARAPGAPTDLVPLPLSPGAWGAILGRKVPREQLARAIFSQQNASLVYYGLMALDDETLAYFESHAALLSAIARRGAGAFAEWGCAIHVTNGRLQLPGGPNASALWQAVVGAAPADADHFVGALFGRGGGRSAFLFDALVHLDPVRQAFALGGAAGDDRVGRFKALDAVFAATRTVDASGAWPVVRHPVGPATVLSRVLVSEGGHMAAPSSRAFWEAVLGGNPAACASVEARGREVDAAWLADMLDRQFAEKRAEWLGTVTFAQRVFGRITAAEMPAACEVVTSFPQDQALLLTLERMRFRAPSDYLAAVGFARRLWAGTNRKAAVVRTAQAQGVLAILEHAFSARVIDAAAARNLVLSLAALGQHAAPPTKAGAPPDGELAPGSVGRWMQSALLPALCPGSVAADDCAVRAVSGVGGPGSGGRSIRWEDQDYRVDLGAATSVRLARIREVQRATPLGEGLALLSIADGLSGGHTTREDLRHHASAIDAVLADRGLDARELFGHGIADSRATLQSVVTRLTASPVAGDWADTATSLTEVADLRLADALASFAYALAIGEPDDAVLMGNDPARSHRFDATLGPATAPWHLPEEVQAPDRSWLVEGSLLGLHIVFAKSWLRRLSIQDPGLRPRPDPQDVRAFGESEVSFNAFDLSDATRDAIVGAIRRGRARWSELVSSPGGSWQAAVAAGIGEWRCRAASWAAGRARPGARDGGAVPSAPADYVSLAELMWLGGPELSQEAVDAWGMSARATGGGLTPQMPRGHSWEEVQGPRGVGLLPGYFADVHLHVAEMLFDLQLPAVLAPGVSSYVVWDVMTAAEMAHPDDWLALVRAVRGLPEDRRFDYVSTLTAIGPLVPAR